ncbi:MAG: LEA type 2 family protein [Thiohalomonadales bacterium]
MSVGEKKVNIDLVFDATNPNDIAIDSLFVNYEIFIKGESFLKGKDVRINLLANGKSIVRIPVEVSYQKALKATQNTIAAILKKDKTLPATAKVNIFGDLVSAGHLSLGVNYEKTVDLSIPIPQDTSEKIKNKLEEKLRRLF